MDFHQKLADYAELIVVHGLNVQPDQLVHLSGEVAHRELLLLLQKASYESGAKYVDLEILDGRSGRNRIEHSKEADLSFFPEYLTRKYDVLVEQEVANAKIVGPEFPEAMKGADPSRTNAVRKAAYLARKRFYDEGIDKSMVHWTVVAAATKAWARRIFPNLGDEEAYYALWEDIFAFCRVGNGDHLQKWSEHDKVLRNRASRLSSLSIDELHFVSPRTDLRVGLHSLAKFQGGRSESSRGVLFEPNLPTEECFTTPDWRRCNGKVSATRPFYVNGELIEGLEFLLQDGEITELSAKKGEAMFREYIASDEGAKRIGEVALVPISSPIFRSGRVFEEILLDENAACHIAIGSGYRFCIQLPEDSTESHWSEVGCNASSVHTDIMISDEQTTVEATLSNGEKLTLIKDGEWCLAAENQH